MNEDAMTTVWVLHHTHVLDEDDEDVKLIGCYSSEALAWAAAERKKAFPGFAAHPEGFTVDAYEIDRDYWTEGSSPFDGAKGSSCDDRTADLLGLRDAVAAARWCRSSWLVDARAAATATLRWLAS